MDGSLFEDCGSMVLGSRVPPGGCLHVGRGKVHVKTCSLWYSAIGCSHLSRRVVVFLSMSMAVCIVPSQRVFFSEVLVALQVVSALVPML